MTEVQVPRTPTIGWSCVISPHWPAQAIGTALNDLLTRVRAVAHRYVRSRLWTYPGGADMVDDVAQEVCVAVFGALSRYRDEGRPFEAFVYGIAARKVADAQRAFAVADVSTPDFRTGRTSRRRRRSTRSDISEVQHIVELMDRLPDKLREILRAPGGSGDVSRGDRPGTGDDTGGGEGRTASGVEHAQGVCGA